MRLVLEANGEHETREIVRADNSTPAPHSQHLANDYRISTSDPWNYAIDATHGATFFDQASARWTSSYAFDDAGEYPFSINVSGCRLPSWTTWNGTNITNVPPPSPVDASLCAGAPVPLRLVPFGSTNIRIAVFPWIAT